jgi:hypothetical protein
LAVASELMSDRPAKALDAISEDNITISSPDPNTEPQDDKVSRTHGLPYGADTQLEVSEIISPPHDSLAPTSRYNFWKYKYPYPYPRLSRFSTSAPSTTPPSPVNTTTALALGDDTKIASKTPDGNTGTAVATSTPPNPLLTMNGLIICCLLSLLIGSLLRSMLSEADYIVYLPAGAKHPDGGEWRELKRLAEWKLGWGRDLVIAIGRR